MEEASFQLNLGRCVYRTDCMGKASWGKKPFEQRITWYTSTFGQLAVDGPIRLDRQVAAWSIVSDKSGQTGRAWVTKDLATKLKCAFCPGGRDLRSRRRG